MLASRWHKVLNDLLGNKTRTLLIVLSIAVGLFAVGTIISARTILSTDMAAGYATINPSSGTVRTVELFDEDFVRSVRAMEGVQDADARRLITTRVQIGPEEWNNLTIFVVEDYDDMRVNRIWPQQGAWPPPEREILIERAALAPMKKEVGDVILIETPDEKQRKMLIAGSAHDMAQLPAQIDNSPYGYISFETLDWFGEEYGFNELDIVTDRPDDKEYSHEVISRVKDKVERNNLTIPMSMIAEPGQLPLDQILQAILLLMGALGLLSLFLSAFLIINTVSALLAQQRRQIGIMKAVGARSDQIMGMYLVMVMIYGLLALIISVPLSIVGARALSRFLAAMFNFDVNNLGIPFQAVLIQLGVGLLVPVLASLYPFMANLRVTATEAMSSFRLGRGRFGTGLIDRLISGPNLWFARRVILRPFVLSLRNIFRNKGRLLLTLVTLTLAGAIFVSVSSVQSSLGRTIDDLMKLWNFDSMIVFSRPYRMERVLQTAGEVPGVEETDVWLQILTRRVRDDGSEGKSLYMFTPRAGSQLVPGPTIVEGRWLLPGDENALVVDAIIHKDEPDIQLGDEIVLRIDGRDRPFQVVGFSLGMMAPIAYANYDYVAGLTGNTNEADAALVAIRYQDEAAIIQTTNALESHFEERGFRVSTVGTMVTERAEADMFFSIIINLLMIMAVLLALVGGLGLMGTMSINVLERTREIGVLRAIGAPNRGVSQIFIVEGIAIGLISWVFGSILGFPLALLLSNAVGVVMLGTPLSFSYSMTGVWIWLILVAFLSALASFIPARNASRLTVREVLAYE